MPAALSIIPVLLFVFWIAPIFPFLYVIVRWRAAGRAEPGLGSYSLVLFFMSGATLLAATAVSTLVFTFLTDDPDADLQRAMWGVLGASAAFFGLQVLVGRSLSPTEDATAATRVFGGFVMALSGLVVFLGLSTLCIALTVDTETMSTRTLDARADIMRASCSALAVFGALYLGSVRSMR